MKHIIKQQVLDLRMDKRLDPFKVQQELSDHYRQDLLPAMEKLFNKLADPDTTIRIDSLEINLGRIGIEMIRNGDWAEHVQAALEKVLVEMIRAAGIQKGTRVQPSYLTHFEQWLHFMEYGVLPWNAGKPGIGWNDQVLESLARHYESADALRDLIKAQGAALERMVQFHEPAFLSHLVELLTASKQSLLAPALNELAGWVYAASPVKTITILTYNNIRKWLWKAILKTAAAQRNEQATASLIVHLLEEQLCIKPGIMKRALQSPTAHLPVLQYLLHGRPAGHAPETGSANDGSNAFIASQTPDENKRRLPGEMKDQHTLIPFKPIPQKVFREMEKDRREKYGDSEPAMLEDGLYIANAGIILLHVFFPHCFRKLGWVEKGRFSGSQQQWRALHLLHYMATGETGPAEYELALPKILCNWPVQGPVVGSWLITQEEKEEAENVLQSAIDQWKQLRNTTPAGLQVNFLQRNGKLYKKNDKWCLQVETVPAIDLLLDSLPWTISMIKLPWMKELLRVEWR